MHEEALRASALSKLTRYVKNYTDMDRERLREMVDHIPVRFFPKGTLLIRQGEMAESLFLRSRGLCQNILHR